MSFCEAIFDHEDNCLYEKIGNIISFKMVKTLLTNLWMA